jgi:fructose-1,6-bisphosphatase
VLYTSSTQAINNFGEDSFEGRIIGEEYEIKIKNGHEPLKTKEQQTE